MLATRDLAKVIRANDLLREIGEETHLQCQCRTCLELRAMLIRARRLILEIGDMADKPHEGSLNKVN